MGNKRVPEEGRKLREEGRRALERIIDFGLTQDRPGGPGSLCRLCKDTQCWRPLDGEDRIAANTCTSWCLGLCAAHASPATFTT